MDKEVYSILVGTGIRPSSTKKYLSDLMRVEDLTGKSVDDLTQADYNKLLVMLESRSVPERFWLHNDSPQHHSTASVRGFIYALKAYWKATDQQDKLKYIKRVPKYVPIKKKPTIGDETIRKFFEDVWSFVPTKDERKTYHVKTEFLEYRNKFIVVFCYFFATRRSEIPLVRLDDIDRKRQTISIEDVKGGGGKFTEPVTSTVFWSYFDKYMEHRSMIPGNFLFPKVGGGQIDVITVYLATRLFDRLLKKYKIHGIKFSPHLMRRSMATRVAGQLSLKDGMHITRHKSVGAFQKYIDMSESQVAIQRIKDSGALDV